MDDRSSVAQKRPRDPACTRLVNGMRQVIETVNDQLADQLRS